MTVTDQNTNITVVGQQSQISVTQQNTGSVEQAGASNSVTNESTTITVVGQQSRIIAIPANPGTIITQGMQGPPGIPGAGFVLTALAGIDLAAHTSVVMVNGSLFPADPTNATHAPLWAGITLAAAQGGEQVTYAIAGAINSFPGLVEGQRYYVALDGSIGTSPVASGAAWLKVLGYAQSNSQLILLPGPSVLL